jgi:hypothetical protein
MPATSLTRLVLPALLSLQTSLPAATFTVPAGDVQALITAMHDAQANLDPSNVIDLAGGTYTLTVVEEVAPDGPVGTPSVTGSKTLEILGNGAVLERSSAPATPEFRLLRIDGVTGTTLTLRDLTLSGGVVGTGLDGGALLGADTAGPVTTALHMTNCVVSGNSSGRHGGGVCVRRCIAVIDGCRFEGNTCHERGGGFYTQLFGDLTMTDCTLRNNTATGPNGAGGGLGVQSNGFGTSLSAILTGCTIEGNQVLGGGGRGGGIYHACVISTSTRIMEVYLSTISGNSVEGDGGGLFSYAENVCCSGSSVVSNLLLQSCTVTGNTATGVGGGFATDDIGGITEGNLRLWNTIVAGNSDSGPSPDGSHQGRFLDTSGYNLIWDNSSIATQFPAGLPNPSQDRVGDAAAPLDPLLDPLADNGGPTWTHALQFGSPAQDVGDPALSGVDQRGEPRPYGAGVDIGAFELGGCSGTCGDCDLNGVFPTILDALQAAQMAAAILTPSPLQQLCCDVDSSAAITVLDALVMAQAAAALPVTLTCQ